VESISDWQHSELINERGDRFHRCDTEHNATVWAR